MKDENVRYRLARAWETYNDASYLFERESYNSCINRLYYAAFYAAIGLLSHSNIEVKSHNGVKRKLDDSFVLKGILTKETVKTFHLLADLRNKGDYDDLYSFDRELVEPLLNPVKNFIEIIDNLIGIK